MLQQYCSTLFGYNRLPTKEVKIGNLVLGNGNPIRVQTMTTTDTMDTEGTVAQSIKCIAAGAEMIRITAPSKKEAENLYNIKNALRAKGYNTPIIADIHFTPNAAEIAARIVEKVRINPGNYIDKKRFDLIEYSDIEYSNEVERIRGRFKPLLLICKQYGTAMRIGTNHGSLSDRIMSRYGDTPNGMVESALEFLRIARAENYHQIVLSMKSSNPIVMVEAYRLLVQKMDEEFGECYPLHLGVTEAGDGDDGRIKSAIGIGSLLEDGIGDTIRVSLTEDPELEIPVCKDIVKRYSGRVSTTLNPNNEENEKLSKLYNPFNYKRNTTSINIPYSKENIQKQVQNIGTNYVPVVIADYSNYPCIEPDNLLNIGYNFDTINDKWSISDAAADFIYNGSQIINFPLPGTLQVIYDYKTWLALPNKISSHPLVSIEEYILLNNNLDNFYFVSFDINNINKQECSLFSILKSNNNLVLILSSSSKLALAAMRHFVTKLIKHNINCPIIIKVVSNENTIDEQLIHFSTETGGLLIDGFGDGLMLSNPKSSPKFLNDTAFSILQATRTRISKTEYISCPSCGRTLFDLQETTAKIRAATHHLKGVKIAIMGCIVNGPGEMADADFGYVGSGPGKITLYKSKEVIKKNVPSNIAVTELITLLKDSGVWVEQ